MNNELRNNELFIQEYQNYQPLIFSVLFSKTGDVDTAEDIAQNVFIKLYEHPGELNSTRRWLYETMRNELLNYFSKKKARGKIAEMQNFEDVGLTYFNGMRDTRIIINDAIEAIATNEIDRSLIDLIGVHKYSFVRAAAELGLTVKQTNYRYKKLSTKIMDHIVREKKIESFEELL